MIAFNGLKDYDGSIKRLNFARPKDPISAEKNSARSANLMRIKLETPKNQLYSHASNSLIGGWFSPTSIYRTPTNKRTSSSKLIMEQNIDCNNIVSTSPAQERFSKKKKKNYFC